MAEKENPDEVEETGEEQEEEPTGEAAAETEQETEEASPKKPTNELKIIIVMKDDRIMLGVQSPNCDPVITTMDGTLDSVLELVPSKVAEAKLKWETNPRYPKADLPEPAPTPTPARTPTATRAPAKPAQRPMF